MTKADLLVFLHQHKHTVISTCGSDSEHQPESALIGFGETDQLELIFGTNNTTRKYTNLKANPKVAFVIGWDDDNITVQYEGLATELQSNEVEPYLEAYHQKVPGAANFKADPHNTYFKVTPTWIRWSNLGENKEVVEFKF